MLTTKDERDKANLRPIDGRYPDFAREVRRLLGWEEESSRPYLTSRMAARKTGVNHATITTMARGDRPSFQTLLKFARELGGDLNKLLALVDYDVPADPLARIGPDVDMTQYDRIPVSTRPASAGWPQGSGDQVEEPASRYIPSDARGIKVQGDCMEPYFRDGDLLFIRPQPGAENGQKVIALLDDDSITCKVYRSDGPRPYLEAANGKYPRIDHGFTIVGVVVRFQRDV